MTMADTFSYFVAVIAIAIAPGPVALVILVRAASRDTFGALGFGLGYSLGGIVIVGAVCFGLATWFSTFPALFTYTPYIMFAYLLWISARMWFGSVDLTNEDGVKRRSLSKSITAGVLTCFISPYMMVLFPLVLPGILDITTLQMPQFLFIATMTFLALAAGSMLIIIFAAQIGRLARTSNGARILNRSLAGVLTIAGGWMAFG